MKQKMIIIGIAMYGAGTEKSFLSFVDCLDFERFEVDLLLAKKEGLFLPMIPEQVNVKVIPEFGDHFLLSNKNAVSLLVNTFVKKKPGALFEIVPFFFKTVLSPHTRHISGNRFWIKFMQKYLPDVEGEYDIALAYWGDRTMFYMIDKVQAKKKITWLHFDYANPPRDDVSYLAYFRKCDGIVTVSTVVDNALKEKLPEIAARCQVIENINNQSLIRRMSLEDKHFPDDGKFTGIRILSVGRFSHQKGYDMIIPVLKRFRDEGKNIRWYIAGDGETKDAIALTAVENNVADMLIFLGATTNPYPYMRDCDIYAMPSRFEGKPIAVEEAKILGCPILVCNYDSAAEQLQDGRFGVIAPISSDGIYDGLTRMIDSPQLRTQLSDTLMAEKFDTSGEIEKFYRMIE